MNWLDIVSVILLSAVKMMLGLALALKQIEQPFYIFLLCSLGGILGTFVFVMLSSKFWHAINLKYNHNHQNDKKKKKIFTSNKRRFITIKNKYGLPGIAVITPLLISIPVGCLLAMKFYKNRHQVILWISASCIVWCFIVSFFWNYINQWF